MPIYEYQCATCQSKFEKLVKMGGDDPPCPTCDTVDGVRKLVSAAGFILKGGGWYKDHYGLKKSTGGSEGGGGESGGAEAGKSEGGKSEGGKSEGGKSEGGGTPAPSAPAASTPAPAAPAPSTPAPSGKGKAAA